MINQSIKEKFNNVYCLLAIYPQGIGTKFVAKKLDLSVSEAYHILSSGVYDEKLEVSEDKNQDIIYYIKGT